MSSLPLLVLLVAAFSLCAANDTCDGNEYDMETQLCCGYQIRQKNSYMMCCGGEWVAKELYNCRYDFFAIRKELDCGGKEYDELEEMCCGGEVYRKVEPMMCCGGKWISTDEYDCVYNKQ